MCGLTLEYVWCKLKELIAIVESGGSSGGPVEELSVLGNGTLSDIAPEEAFFIDSIELTEGSWIVDSLFAYYTSYEGDGTSLYATLLLVDSTEDPDIEYGVLFESLPLVSFAVNGAIASAHSTLNTLNKVFTVPAGETRTLNLYIITNMTGIGESNWAINAIRIR